MAGMVMPTCHIHNPRYSETKVNSYFCTRHNCYARPQRGGVAPERCPVGELQEEVARLEALLEQKEERS
jgi:hypothetical protein